MRLKLEDLPDSLQRQACAQLQPLAPAVKSPILERPARNGALGKGKGKKDHPRRVLVRVTSFRRRLLDEDNLCEKFHVDCCRYAGILLGDAPGQAKIEACQQKVKTSEEEGTLVEIFPLDA